MKKSDFAPKKRLQIHANFKNVLSTYSIFQFSLNRSIQQDKKRIKINFMIPKLETLKVRIIILSSLLQEI